MPVRSCRLDSALKLAQCPKCAVNDLRILASILALRPDPRRRPASPFTSSQTTLAPATTAASHTPSGLDAESQFVAGESSVEFAELQHEYFTRFQPLTPEERSQVDILIRNEWIVAACSAPKPTSGSTTPCAPAPPMACP